MARRFMCAVALALLACGDGDSPVSAPDAAVDAGGPASDEGGSAAALGPRALVHNALWSEVADERDPFVGDGGLRCPAESYGDELLGGELVLFVRTERCPRLTLWQASREDVAEGDLVSVRMFHFPLSAPASSVASIRLLLGDSELFRAQVPIPSDQNALSSEWTAPRDYPRGTPLWFHIENHGSNEYTLIEVSVRPAGSR